MTVEVFLDETPGEIRGVVMRDGRFEHLLIEREDDVQPHRLGARSVGRVASVEPSLKGAFVDLGVDPGVAGFCFLPLKGEGKAAVGDKVEVEVVAEPRRGKGPALKLIGPGQGAPRLLSPGPGVKATLAILTPGVEPATGLEAIQASWDAEEEAGFPGELFPDTGLDLMVERTRAMVTVDLDFAAVQGAATGMKARDRANRQGLQQAARTIGLKRWGGLVAIDLIGTNLDGAPILAAAKAAFGRQAAFGPINRFGVLQLALPWRRTPLEEIFAGADGRRMVAHRAQDVVRGLRHALLSDTASPRIVERCPADVAALAAPLVARLGPRAAIEIEE